ncbi:MAG TPA: 3-oxoacid CoA-transferase subunit A [Candidatus Limnocylindria bacterium]|nr:3-oxoacid CoA-transferase subunit A [Candidatus Limnocylindria bacterium]
MEKVLASARAAVADVRDGATVLIGGFGVVQGWPTSLLTALRDHGARDLTIVANTPGVGPTSPQILAEAGLVRKLVASYAVYPKQRTPMEAGIRAGRIELELVPQGTLVERLRAGGAGLAAFYTPTGADTEVRRDAEVREFDGRRYVLETALRGDVALVRASRADRAGNLVYRRGARNFNPVMATAARTTIAEVDDVVAMGDLDPEAVVTPGVYVDRVVRTEHPLDAATVRELSRRWGRQWDLEVRERASGPRGIPPDLMVRRVARLLAPGEYVNLGLGLPTLVSSALEPADGVVLHSENGMLGFGPLAAPGEEDIDAYNASGQLVRQYPGASYFDSASAFGMARSGRVTTVVLGGFQVSARGDLANWNVPASGVGGIGGAMDLAAGAARVVVVMFHLTRDGAPKLVERCTYPLTAARCVRTVVTDFALIDVGADGFVLREVAPGIEIDDVRRATAAPLHVPANVRPMTFD